MHLLQNKLRDITTRRKSLPISALLRQGLEQEETNLEDIDP
jgi:hypothetical protein